MHYLCVDDFECDAEALTKTGTLRSNNAALAVVHMAPEDSSAPTGWTLALEDINDPGNLGAILRIADWYGFSDVMCSPQTRSEEHTSELQSRGQLVCRLLLEKKHI